MHSDLSIFVPKLRHFPLGLEIFSFSTLYVWYIFKYFIFGSHIYIFCSQAFFSIIVLLYRIIISPITFQTSVTAYILYKFSPGRRKFCPLLFPKTNQAAANPHSAFCGPLPGGGSCSFQLQSIA